MVTPFLGRDYFHRRSSFDTLTMNVWTLKTSRLLLNDNNDLARTSDYEVSIDFAENNQCPCEITRNGEYTGEFTVSNTGTFDDTYDLSVTWDDEYELGWGAVPDQETISLSAGTQGVVSFTYNAPVQGIYDGDSMNYNGNGWNV